MKNGLSQIIVNIEAQKDEPPEYKLLNRAIFYVSRLISSQQERDFVNTNSDDIKPVSYTHLDVYKRQILWSYARIYVLFLLMIVTPLQAPSS